MGAAEMHLILNLENKVVSKVWMLVSEGKQLRSLYWPQHYVQAETDVDEDRQRLALYPDTGLFGPR